VDKHPLRFKLSIIRQRNTAVIGYLTERSPGYDKNDKNEFQ